MSGAEAATAVTVAMPAVSEGMEEGTLLRWLVADGAEVAAGDPLAEIETDKAATEVEAPEAGRVWHVAAQGDTVPVGGVLATLGEERSAAGAPVEGAPTAPAAGAGTPADRATTAPPAGDGGPASRLPDGRMLGSPLARRIAWEHGIALDGLKGSGPRGRIVRADVLAELSATAQPAPSDARPQQAVAAPAAAAGGGGRGETTRVTLTQTQKTIARRMAESRATVPTFEVSIDVDMTQALELRRGVRALTGGTDTPAPSVNDMIVKACGVALRRHPRVNGSYVDGAFELHGRVNVGVAVASDDALLVPTIFDADRRSLAEIATAARALVARARTGSVTPPELSGGTFTVSNLGMLGVSRFTAIVNPPQAAILAVGRVAPVAALIDEEIAMRPTMSLTLSSDHRILYGADAAAFLATVRDQLEQPLALLVGDPS